MYRAAVKIAAEQGWKAPSYTVVREVIAGLDRGLLALAHHDGSVWGDTSLDCGVCVLDLDVEDYPKIAQLSELIWEVSHSPPRLSWTVL